MLWISKQKIFSRYVPMFLSGVLVAAGFMGYWVLRSARQAQAGFTYYRAITVNHTKVQNTNQLNFPVLISGTYSYLATVPNGGNVQNNSGYDVGFYTSSDCSTGKMAWETEKYIASTGEVVYWVKVASLSASSDTVFYMCYGNSAISTDQSNVTGVWNNNYKGVWHLPNGSSLSVSDSTGLTTTTNHSATAGMGKIDGNASFASASSQYLDGGNTPNLDLGNNMTISTWVKFTSVPGAFSFSQMKLISRGSDNVSEPYYLSIFGDNTNPSINFGSTISPTTTQQASLSNTPVFAGAWYHLAGTYDGSVFRLYKDGSEVASTTAAVTIPAAGSTTFALGARYFTVDPAQFLNGDLDEVRISNTARTADWIKTEYNNQNSPATFYTVGSEQSVATAAAPTQKGVTIKNSKVCIGGCGVTNSTPALITHGAAGASSQTATATTPSLNSTGANLLVAVVTSFAQSAALATVADSKNNPWTVVQNYGVIGGENVAIWYAKNATTGTSHTFSVKGNYSSIAVYAFSNMDTANPLGQQNGAGDGSGAVTSVQTGSITAATNGVMVAGLAYDLGTPSIDSGFSNPPDEYGPIAGGQHAGYAESYAIVTSGTTKNPTWSNLTPTSGGFGAAIASFKAGSSAAGGGGAKVRIQAR